MHGEVFSLKGNRSAKIFFACIGKYNKMSKY